MLFGPGLSSATAPDAPAQYFLWYIDSRGLPSLSQYTRLTSFEGSALPSPILASKEVLMASSQVRPRRRRVDSVHKPRGILHPRVQDVGPEHLGIVAVDGAKDRSKWMLTDSFGKILVPPTIVEH